MASDAVLVAAISTIGGIIATYITVKAKNAVVKRNRPAVKNSRMDNIFDGYERLISQLTADMDRKEKSIERMENIISDLEVELAKTKQLLKDTKHDLHHSLKQKADLAKQLDDMRKQYGLDKGSK